MADTNDLIRREDAMMAVAERINQIGYNHNPLVLSIMQAIVDVPSAQKTGKWIEDDDRTIAGHCSLCGWKAIYDETDVFGMPYCPSCGARMESE